MITAATTSRTTLAALGLALALGACSSDDAASPEATSPGQATDAAEATIDDFRFRPETLEVGAGSTVTWTNEDDTAHTVTAGSEDAPEEDRFDLEVGAAGDTVSHTFDEPGSYAYFCELHPFMTGTVEVSG